MNHERNLWCRTTRFADVKRAYRRLFNAWRPVKAVSVELASRRIAEEKMWDVEAVYAYFRNKFGKVAPFHPVASGSESRTIVP